MRSRKVILLGSILTLVLFGTGNVSARAAGTESGSAYISNEEAEAIEEADRIGALDLGLSELYSVAGSTVIAGIGITSEFDFSEEESETAENSGKSEKEAKEAETEKKTAGTSKNDETENQTGQLSESSSARDLQAEPAVTGDETDIVPFLLMGVAAGILLVGDQFMKRKAD